MTTKILALADGLGNLVRFVLMPGQRGEITGAEKLIEGLSLGAPAVLVAQDSEVESTAIANRSESCAPRLASKSVSFESDLQADGNPQKPNERQHALNLKLTFGIFFNSRIPHPRGFPHVSRPNCAVPMLYPNFSRGNPAFCIDKAAGS
jgi:hypothetical protein